MSDTNRPSLGAMLGKGAGMAYAKLRGEPGRKILKTPLPNMLGSEAGTAYGKLRGEPERNKRIYRGLRAGASVFWQSAKITLHMLFLELSGVMFLCFTFVIAAAFMREFKKYETHQVGMGRVALAGAISLMFFYFGLSSFWRARRKRPRVQS